MIILSSVPVIIASVFYIGLAWACLVMADATWWLTSIVPMVLILLGILNGFLWTRYYKLRKRTILLFGIVLSILPVMTFFYVFFSS